MFFESLSADLNLLERVSSAFHSSDAFPFKLMTQIDKYVLFLYGRVFLVCYLTLSGLLVVVQVFTNVDEFIEFGEMNGGFAKGLAIYFTPQVLSLYDKMCGLITLLATMFVVAWLNRTNELTAILAAGIPKGRIIKPLLLASIVMIVIGAILRETVIPQHAEMLNKRPKDLFSNSAEALKPAEDTAYGFVVVGRSIQPSRNAIVNPVFEFTGPTAERARQIKGGEAIFLKADENHPDGYLVNHFEAAEKIVGTPSVHHDGQPFLLLPSDTPWLEPHQCFIVSELEFDMLSGGGSKQYASTLELVWRVKNQSYFYTPDKQVILHSRIVQPFLDLTQLLIGLPLILSTRHRNVVVMIASCILSFGVFFGITFAIRTLGSNGTLLTPSAAAWAPLLLFAPAAWAKSVRAMHS